MVCLEGVIFWRCLTVSTKSEKSHARLDVVHGVRKGEKVISVVREFKVLANCDVLDIGTGSGAIASELSKISKSVSSVDVCDERLIRNNYKFIEVKGARLPFKDETFDIVISNHVVEHIPLQDIHMREVYRVLKKGGIAYLATPNKYWVLEPHFYVPFLSMLPRRLSSIIVRLLKGREWDIYPLSYKDLCALACRFEVVNMTPEVIKNFRKYHLGVGFFRMFLELLPLSMIRRLNLIYPTYILVLKK